MRAAIGLILSLIGGGVVVFGIVVAVRAFGGLYEGATTNAMGMSATAEEDTSKAMIRAVIIGACGVPLLIAGTVLLKVSMFQRLARSSRGVGARRSG